MGDEVTVISFGSDHAVHVSEPYRQVIGKAGLLQPHGGTLVGNG